MRIITSLLKPLTNMNIKESSNDLVLFTPYYQNGSVEIKSNFDDGAVKALFNEISYELSILNDLNLFHGRIKPSNILIREDGRFILSNYNENELSGIDSYNYEELFFTSPEVLQNKEISNKSDIFSLGVLLHHVVFDKSPILYFDENERMNKYCNIIYRCCDTNPDKRPTIKDIQCMFSNEMKERLNENDITEIYLKEIRFLYELLSNGYNIRDSIMYNKILINKSIIYIYNNIVISIICNSYREHNNDDKLL